MFVFHLDITAGNFLDWKIMQMENCYFYLGKIVWYMKIFNLLILICEYLFGKNILWNWDSEYLRSVRHKFKLCLLGNSFLEAGTIGNITVWGDEGFIIFWAGIYDYLGLFGKKNRRLCFLNASFVYWCRNWNEISLRPFLEIMFFGNMFFWSLISDSIEWAHDSRFCGEKIG